MVPPFAPSCGTDDLQFAASCSWGIGYFSGTQLAQIERRLEFQDSSVVNRATVAKNALTAMKAKPLLGVGFGQFNQLDRVVDITAEKKRGGHSFYLSLAASSGLPACLLFILFALIQWRKMALAVTGWQPSFRQNDEWSDRYRLAWMSALFRALLIYHATSLTIRGNPTSHRMDNACTVLRDGVSRRASSRVIKSKWRGVDRHRTRFRHGTDSKGLKGPRPALFWGDREFRRATGYRDQF